MNSLLQLNQKNYSKQHHFYTSPLIQNFKTYFKAVRCNKIAFAAIFLLSDIFISTAIAKDRDVEYRPTISGFVLMQFQGDSIVSSQNKDIKRNNAAFYLEPNFSLHVDENWSVKTQWRLQSNDTLTTRDNQYPERYRTILSNKRSLNNFNNTGLLVEELKINFENEDLRFYAGKFDPQFGTAHRKSKRIGVFTSQFAEDYNLREKIGGGVVALLEGSQLRLDTFFNDVTDLSSSAINDRGRETQSNGIAGNTGTISSYSVSVEGERFFSVKNLFYNFGYRSLGVRGGNNTARESGYVFGTEYLYKIRNETSIIPFIELVRLENYGGKRGRTGDYATAAIMLKYRNWVVSSSLLQRKTQNIITGQKNNDRQLQLSAGYKFTDNLALDVTRAKVRESKSNAGVFGVNISYLYKF